MNSLSPYQLQIIRKLTLRKTINFNRLHIKEIPSDHFNYHLKKLIKKRLVRKNKTGLYELTLDGKVLASRMGKFPDLGIKHQTKTHLVPICHRIHNKQEQFLIRQRKKNPYFNYFELPSMKADMKVSFYDNLKEKMQRETGFSGTPKVKLIRHILVKMKGKKEIIEDKVFYFFVIENLKGILLKNDDEGINFWMTLDMLKRKEKKFPHILSDCTLHRQRGIKFEEEIQIYKNI